VEVESRPLFSVVMPTWNRGSSIRKAVSSVLAQTFTDFELLVVDDCSEVPAALVLTDLVKDDRVRCIRLERNNGVGPARNVGIDHARGEYVAFLDDDDEYFPTKLAEIAAVVRHHDTDVVYHKMQIHLVREGYSYTNAPFEKHFSYSDLLLKNLLGSPSMVVVRRDALITVGKFHGSLPALEDYELWLRLCKAGFRFKYIDRVLTNYYRDTRRASKSLSLKNDIAAWRLLHEIYEASYKALPQEHWREHMQKTVMFRGFRCLLSYRRLLAARYFIAAFLWLPRIGSLVLLAAAVLSLLSPRLCLILQSKFKSGPSSNSLFVPGRARGAQQ
jgi:glycosyltransferase involved in cell wall biosynthesis